MQMGLIDTIVNIILGALITALWAYLARFVKEQRRANSLNQQFIRSMQRAEITRYFRIVVEEGKPITTEELEHLEKCYNAYHDAGNNGVGTLMYDRIHKHVVLITKMDTDDVKIGGTE